MALFLLLLFLSIAHDKCVSGKRLDMTPGNPPFQKTVNSSSAKASLAQDFVSQKRSLTDCAPMGMTSPPCPPCPLHPSFMSLGAFAPQPAASLASTVEWRARLWARPVGAFYPEPSTFLPCPAEAGRGPRGDSPPLYRQNLLSTIWPLGRQVPAGRWPARNLQALRRGFLQKSCRRRKVVQVLGGGCSCFTVSIALLQQLSLNRSRDFLALKTQDLAAFSFLGGVLFAAKVL